MISRERPPSPWRGVINALKVVGMEVRQAERMIKYDRQEVEILMREGHIKPPPG